MKRRERKEPEDVNPDLIPIMNLFTALIPFLLASAAFYQMSVIQITVPVQSEGGETDVAKDEDKVTLNMRMTNATFDLSASSDTLDPSVVEKLKQSVPRKPGGSRADRKPTLDALGEAAYKIKGNYAASDTVIVVPDDDVAYEEVIEALDAVRMVIVEREGQPNKIKLFPKAVLSSLIK